VKINVHSKREGFRRAGIEFGKAPRTLDTDKLTKGQLEAIEAEPMLVVVAADAKHDPNRGDDSGNKPKAKGGKS
jgi:hypothetical protein